VFGIRMPREIVECVSFRPKVLGSEMKRSSSDKNKIVFFLHVEGNVTFVAAPFSLGKGNLSFCTLFIR
jgi:hypothetical protein